MSEPPFRIGDRVVCVNRDGSELAMHGVYNVFEVTENGAAWFIAISSCIPRRFYLASRFIHEQDTPCPSLADDYPESSEDYEHNTPHHVIVWGAASLLIWLAFFAGLWMGWMWL